jgi:glycosyltransferase involved in cell wall biosynthesis
MKTAIVIPAFNEEKSTPLVIGDIPKTLSHDLVVVNNGSFDKTEKICNDIGVKVINESRKGYGRACLKGIDYFKSKSPDIIVFLDADYSDFPQEIHSLINSIINDQYDFVLGSRISGKRESGAILPQALIGNKFAVLLIKWFFGFQYTDCGPLRALRFQKLLEINMQDTTFAWNVEMQSKAIIHNLRINEVPVSYRKRIGVSKITGTFSGTVRAGIKIIFTILKLALINRLKLYDKVCCGETQVIK